MGVRAGVTLLTLSDPRNIRMAVGVLLVLYSLYVYFRPALKPIVAGGGAADSMAGFLMACSAASPGLRAFW